MYVSLWYIIGTVLWIIPLWVIGNVMWHPPVGAITGVNDVIFNWFYGHNILGLWFTTGLIPVIYFIVPRETKTPLFSHFLSLIGFWAIVFFYTGVGGHHLLWTPIPHWLKTMAVADSIGMIIPVTAFLLNIYLTMRGNWNRLGPGLALRFVVLGWAAYIIVSYQGTHFALKGINYLTHFTQYVPSHAHLSLLFFSGITIMGGMYYVVPRVSGRQIFSPLLANIQFVLMIIGFTFFLAGFILAGFVQGGDWVYIGLPVYTSLAAEKPFFALRAGGGIVLYLSLVLFAINMFGTWVAGKREVKPDSTFIYEQTTPHHQEGVHT
jgi:cbb3-type cytochrome c oxidase subunit I